MAAYQTPRRVTSTSTTVTVAAAGTSALAALAASMSANTWAQLVVPNQNAATLTEGLGSVPSGSSGSVLPYSNSVPYNPFSRRIEFISQDHTKW